MVLLGLHTLKNEGDVFLNFNLEQKKYLMAKLGCKCGHTIVDQTVNIPYKGHILLDKHLFDALEKLTDFIDGLVDAIKSDKRDEWVKKNFNVPPYPMELRESSMIYDLFSDYLRGVQQDIYECENCGRIALQVGQSQHFKFFSPENPDTKGILNPENNQV